MQIKTSSFSLGEKLKMTAWFDIHCFPWQEKISLSFPGGENTSFDKSGVFLECGGIKGWLNEWVSVTSRHYCRLTICSAVAQTERTRAHCSLLQNAHTLLYWAGLSCPLQLIFGSSFEACGFAGTTLYPSHLLEWWCGMMLTTFFHTTDMVLNGETDLCYCMCRTTAQLTFRLWKHFFEANISILILSLLQKGWLFLIID